MLTQAQYNTSSVRARAILKQLDQLEQQIALNDDVVTSAEHSLLDALNWEHDRLVGQMTEFEIENYCPCNF